MFFISAAEEARKQFNEVDEKVRSAQSNIELVSLYIVCILMVGEGGGVFFKFLYILFAY